MAQEEYTWEMGGVIGGSFLYGKDANSSTPFKRHRYMGGFYSPVFTESTHGNKGNLTAGRISVTRDFKNVYPNGEYATFKRTIIDLGAQFEYNFLRIWYHRNALRGDRRFTLYIRWIGFTFAPKPVKTVFDEHPHRS